MNTTADMPAKDEKISRRGRLLFALLFALVPNAIAFFVAYSAESLLALAYIASVPGLLAASSDTEGLSVTAVGIALNILVDASIAYLVTALKYKWLWLGVGLLVAYVAISRFIALQWLLLYVATHT